MRFRRRRFATRSGEPWQSGGEFLEGLLRVSFRRFRPDYGRGFLETACGEPRVWLPVDEFEESDLESSRATATSAT